MSVKNKNIVIGICGIGRGHCVRQLPIVTKLATNNRLILFCFGESLEFYTKRFRGNTNVEVREVVVPWIVGNVDGIDFKQTAGIKSNDTAMYFTTNMLTMQYVFEKFGKPDLVISDYEPISAQLSYALNVPLLTIDQQSKYLDVKFPIINGMSSLSESARLSLFFPKATKRIACSYFRLPTQSQSIELVPTIIKPSVLKQAASIQQSQGNTILVYLSPYSNFVQPELEVLTILHAIKRYSFKLFVSRDTDYMQYAGKYPNITIYYHGDTKFDAVMSKMVAAVSTAGHTFLAEAMYMGRPVFAIPLGTYEQAYNAKVIADNGFGLTDSKLTLQNLKQFTENIPAYTQHIIDDTTVLYKQDGLSTVMGAIASMF